MYNKEYYLKKYCRDIENVENYSKALADSFVGWCCHHRLETHNSDEERRLVDITASELKALGMYYNRPAEELILLTNLEHNTLHRKGKPRSEETRSRISIAHKGKHYTEDHRKKLSEALKGNQNAKGKHWYNNGVISVRYYECPVGFIPGRLKRKEDN